jgi:hypothetical protein
MRRQSWYLERDIRFQLTTCGGSITQTKHVIPINIHQAIINNLYAAFYLLCFLHVSSLVSAITSRASSIRYHFLLKFSVIFRAISSGVMKFSGISR